MSLELQLRDRLQQLAPTYLEIVNESSGHGGYFPGKESQNRNGRDKTRQALNVHMHLSIKDIGLLWMLKCC